MSKKNKEIKTLLVRVPKEIYIKMRHISIETNKSLNQYVVDYFKNICQKEEGSKNEKI